MLDALGEQVLARRWRILAAVLLGTIMGPIDASVVYISLPAMAHDFGVDPASIGWVSMGYLLVLGSLMLAFGRLGDILGFRKVFLAGLLSFVAASSLCGLAPNLTGLILLRILQAAGAGMTMAMAPAIITAVFPTQERGRALGLNGMVVALGLALGPSLGGLLTETLGWRSIFFVNVPIGIASYLWCRRLLPEFPAEAKQHFDWAGAALAFVGLGLLLLATSRGQACDWSWPVWVLGSAAALLLLWFVNLEKRVPEPMLEVSLFRIKVFAFGNLATLLNFMTQYVIVFSTPFLLQQAMGFTAGRAGVIMTAFPLTVLVVAPVAGALSDRIGQRGLAFTGSLLCTVAALLLGLVETHFSSGVVAWHLGLFGLGTGLFQSPNNSAIMGSVPRLRLGIAAGVLSATRCVGMVLGIAMASAILETRASFFLSSLHRAYMAAALVSFMATVACLWTKLPAPEPRL
ncbi:MFS transporter [Desulfothermobacter acidiphilus]|uniref:MFS transporter n=1 Tax=Desulfothermobacter acidiphilus TaxID=1938353 RepID=UPI003F88AA7C